MAKQDAKTKIEEIVAERYRLSQLKSSIEDQLRELADSVTAYMITNDLKTETIGKFKVSFVESKRTSIDKMKLMEAGVTAEQITKATVITPSQYTTVKPLKEEN